MKVAPFPYTKKITSPQTFPLLPPFSGAEELWAIFRNEPIADGSELTTRKLIGNSIFFQILHFHLSFSEFSVKLKLKSKFKVK